MKIKKIKKLNNGKYKIEFNNQDKITTYDSVILNHNLLYSKEIDSALVNQIQIDTNYYDIYNKALRYIMTKMRSEKEMYEYLKKKEIPEDQQDKIISDLKQVGVLDDKKYAHAFVADQVHLSHLGPNQIFKKLLEHNIPKEVIEEELQQYDTDIFQQKLQKLLQKKISSNSKYSNYQLKQKLVLEFVNQGYEKDMIVSLLDILIQDDSTILAKEYQNLYRKLSRKYAGNELLQQIKNKLYQKGFSSDDIKRCMEE